MFNTRKRMKETIETQSKLIQNRDNFIEKVGQENRDLRNKIVDLENNIEFLVDNLSKNKRELVRPEQTTNPQ